jgi:hypothetical protein
MLRWKWKCGVEGGKRRKGTERERLIKASFQRDFVVAMGWRRADAGSFRFGENELLVLF